MPNQFPVSPLEDRRLGSAEVEKNNEVDARIAEQPPTVEVAEALRRAMAAYAPRDMTKHEIHPAGELAEHAVTGAKIETSVPRISREQITQAQIIQSGKVIVALRKRASDYGLAA